MKKLLVTLVAFVILLSGCNNKAVQNSNNISLTDVESITIKALPSPPKVKTIDKKEDIEKIINHINSINKEKTKQEDIKGWQFFIETKGKQKHSITFMGDLIKIDGALYKIDDDEVKNFREIYNSLNYKEESAIK